MQPAKNGQAVRDRLTRRSFLDTCGGLALPAVTLVTSGCASERRRAITHSPDGDIIFDIWYGARQSFGRHGSPHKTVNILGRVVSKHILADLSYTLNGGPRKYLSFGPSRRRLHGSGDFNVEVPRDNLVKGRNTVEITAIDSRGRHAFTSVVVVRESNGPAPLPCTVRWNGLFSHDVAVEVVDGLWEARGGSVRTMGTGSNRMLAVGDIGWSDYEVTAGMTIHDFDHRPAAYAPPENGPSAGIGLLFRGYSCWDEYEQPCHGWMDIGAICQQRWLRGESRSAFELTGGANGVRRTLAGSQRIMPTGRPCTIRARCHTTDDRTTYTAKCWYGDEPEPTGWSLSADMTGLTGPPAGSIALSANFADVSFGTVTVTSLS